MHMMRGLAGLCLMLALMLAACGDEKKLDIGDRISGPFDMVFVKKWGDYLVLNSSYDSRFETGSLLRMGLVEGAPVRKQALSVPRLGTKLALNKDDSAVAIGFLGTRAKLEIYRLGSEALEATPLVSQDLDGGDLVTGLDWFNISAAGQNKVILAVSLGAKISSVGTLGPVRVRFYEFADGSLKPWFTVPDDLTGARNDVYQINSSFPVYLESENLLVLFPPRPPSGFLEALPSSYEVLKQGQWIGETDLRSVTAVAIDLELLISGTSLDRSVSFFPLVVNVNNLGQADLEKPADDPQNRDLSFKSRFVSALAARSSECGSVAGGKPSDFVLVADDGGHVFGLTGFAKLKQDFRATGAVSDQLANHFFPKSVQVELYSRGSGATGLPDNGNLRVTEMTSVDWNGQGECAPVVVRADRKSFNGTQLNAGREDVFVSHVVGRTDSDPVVGKTPVRGAVGFAASGSELLFFSFSRNALFPISASPEGFSVGTVFEEKVN